MALIVVTLPKEDTLSSSVQTKKKKPVEKNRGQLRFPVWVGLFGLYPVLEGNFRPNHHPPPPLCQVAEYVVATVCSSVSIRVASQLG